VKKASTNAELKECKVFLEDFRESRPDLLQLIWPSDYAPLMSAAKFFGFDLAKKDDAHYLLCILAGVLFPEKGKGRKKGNKQWEIRRVLDLGHHFREVESDNPGISDSEAARKIHERYPQEYQSAAAVRPRLAGARRAQKISMTRLENEPSEEILALEKLLWFSVWMEEVDEMPSEKRRLFLKHFMRPGFLKMLVQWGREEAIKRSL
jgi:hypothetical protein